MLLTVCIEAGRQTLLILRGPDSASVPANGCLARCRLGRSRRSQLWLHFTPAPTLRGRFFQAKGDLRLLLTFTYHGCPHIPRKKFAACTSGLKPNQNIDDLSQR